MWSQYLRTRERDRVVAIFHELHPDPVFCSVSQWEGLIAGKIEDAGALVSELRQRRLIIDSPEDDRADFETVAARLERKLNQPTILYLMTAQGCNFNCTYCPVPDIAKKHGDARLSTEDAFAGINLWREHLKDVYDPDVEYFVIFYGGEPLLNKEVIRASLDYLRTQKNAGELPERLNFMIATNGALVDEGIIALCKEYGVMVAVGLDGPKTANDALKVDSDGNGTFDRIVTTIRMLVDNGIKTCVSVSVTPFNIDQIAGYADFFSELGVEKFGFNFLKGRKLLEQVGREGLASYYRQAARGIIEQSRRQCKPGFEYQMEKKQLAFDRGDFFPVDCTCYGNQLVIRPDGQVSNCPFYRTQLGHVQSLDGDFRIWNQAVVKEWRKRLPLYHPGEAKALCGGGCSWSSSELYGSVLAADESSNIFAMEALDELIWSRYDRLMSRSP